MSFLDFSLRPHLGGHVFTVWTASKSSPHPPRTEHGKHTPKSSGSAHVPIASWWAAGWRFRKDSLKVPCLDYPSSVEHPNSGYFLYIFNLSSRTTCNRKVNGLASQFHINPFFHLCPFLKHPPLWKSPATYTMYCFLWRSFTDSETAGGGAGGRGLPWFQYYHWLMSEVRHDGGQTGSPALSESGSAFRCPLKYLYRSSPLCPHHSISPKSKLNEVRKDTTLD